MKPKQLRYPHRWEERTVALQDSILWVPTYYDRYEEHQFPGWDDLQVFGNQNPVYVEYCSGNGDWLVDRAKRYPEINWVGVEKRFDRVRKIWSKKNNQAIDNLFIVCGEAQTSTKFYFPKESVDALFINFPDPWPKDRHAKHRLIQEPFAKEMADVLKPGGTATIVTDDVPYSEQVIKVMLKGNLYTSEYPNPYFSHEREGYGSSWFEDLWREKGRKIRYHLFRKGS